MPADNHIPVTEETWESLNQLKDPGETYDELLLALAQERHRRDLTQRLNRLEASDRDELTALDDI